MTSRMLTALLLSVLCATGGQLLMRSGAAGFTAPRQFVNLPMVSGLGLYGVSTLLWIAVLSKTSLTLVYPFTACTIVLVILAGTLFLGEPVTVGGLIGVGFIVAGLGIIYLAGKAA